MALACRGSPQALSFVASGCFAEFSPRCAEDLFQPDLAGVRLLQRGKFVNKSPRAAIISEGLDDKPA
jgi:hypothetical protein